MIALELLDLFHQDIWFDFRTAGAHDASTGLTKQLRFHSADSLPQSLTEISILDPAQTVLYARQLRFARSQLTFRSSMVGAP